MTADDNHGWVMFAGLPESRQPRGGGLPVMDQRRWQSPVCFGKGFVPSGFYASPGVTVWPSTDTSPEKCRSCDGRGIVL